MRDLSDSRIPECCGLTEVISWESRSRSLSKKLGSSSDMLEHKKLLLLSDGIIKFKPRELLEY